MEPRLTSKLGQRSRILGKLAAADFVGRDRDFERILRHVRKTEGSRGMLVLAAPADGSSELLRQVYDQLFEERGIIPFYFALNKSDQTVEAAARRFLHSFLLQSVAFRRGDAHLLGAAPELSEIAELAAPADGYWIDRLILNCEDERRAGDERAFVRQALSAPLRAAAHGAVSVVIIDDFHHAESLSGDVSIVEEINQIYARSTVPFVIAGRRRYLLGATQGGEHRLENTAILKLPALTIEDAAKLTENLARHSEVALNEQTRDLIVQQLECKPTFIANLILAARDRKISLDSFDRCQQVYVEDVLGGRIGRYFSSIFDEVAPNIEIQREVFGVLRDALTTENKKSSIEFWRKRVETDGDEFYKIMRGLHLHEIVRLGASLVEMPENGSVAKDYILTRHRIEIEAVPRALVLSNLLVESLKRAPQIMAGFYRRSAALNLRELLAVFYLQEIPAVLFDYARFRRFYKGLDAAEISLNLEGEKERLTLPQIVFAANCADFYPPIGQITNPERSAVALGFEAGNYADENQIVWLAAEVESKLEASAETTEFWLDRLEAAALFCNFNRARFWLVTPEGFAPDAIELLNERGAFGSSRAQVELLAELLKAENVLSKQNRENSHEYELVVPMGDDTELIAAQAVEEIARRYDFKPAAINQIKTALVEACINAAEHSLSPDRKIYQKFALEGDKLVITVSNRGLQMPAKAKTNGNSANDEEHLTGRRGWGIKLIRNLMDEVEFEQTDDGTRIRMAKKLQ